MGGYEAAHLFYHVGLNSANDRGSSSNKATLGGTFNHYWTNILTNILNGYDSSLWNEFDSIVFK